jgi:hypothetical protein
MPPTATATWNSLEVAKLFTGILTPLSVVALGFWISRRLRRLEHHQWVNQKVIEKRLSIYEELVPKLNKLLCFFIYVGDWKEANPPEIVKLKRELDRIAHVNAVLLTDGFMRLYNELVNSCYETHTGWGEDAKLKSKYERRKQAAGQSWQASWDACFCEPNKATEANDIHDRYDRLLNLLAVGLGVEVKLPNYQAKIPHNIR